MTGSNVTEAYSVIASDVNSELGMSLSTFALILFVIMLVSGPVSVIQTYFCIVIGQLFPGHRVLCAIAVYFIMATALQIIALLIMLALGVFPGYNFFAAKGQTMAAYTINIFSVSAVLTIIITIAQYAVTHYIMNKKINLI